ncbi:EAL domain-containing protein [Photobacterium rosenbergii]|uniref:EAL domain-containing response regulator n=1 Tax=Photobacterium rosenbergii TaxID=294936 RepID=UPI001C9916C7|nr:EAL domain-containing response regulator [Photobacterium rosenbergii]MBY5948726.1 EAL domain-containing response regulator [Photobacterium rosenbergii]
MNILLVEDHPFQQQVLRNQLERAATGSCVSVASTGKEALAQINITLPDVLVCDLNMPEMDGITFLSHLAKMSFHGAIIISSAASPDVIKSVSQMCKSYQLKVIGCLEKPARHEHIQSLLGQAEQYLSTPQPEQAPHSAHVLSVQVLNMAFEHQWLVPYYQPIVDIRTGEWCGNEALIRLEHPDMGLLPPARFLSVIEKMGREHELAMMTIHHVVSNLPAFSGRRVAVNITPHTLISEGFVDQVIALQQRFPTISQTLSFEITESDAIEHTGPSLEAAARLGMYGFKLSIDDFGTGYSSLKQLEQLPFESLKLDMSFIQALPKSKTAAAILEASLLLANRLSLSTIAEGIECSYQWQALRQMGCHCAQGYFIGRPMPVGQLKQWHHDWNEKQHCASL